MHPTALQNAQLFFQVYATANGGLSIVDVGSLDVNGSLRGVSPPGSKYLGIDFSPGNGVDLVLDDPYCFKGVEDASQDIVVSSSCFEHSEMFWLVFLEIMRILKPGGLFYLNVPSNGPFHRYPVDCWRFYPDAAKALETWGVRSGLPVMLLESFTTYQLGGYFNDYIAIFLRDRAFADHHPKRCLDTGIQVFNGYVAGKSELKNSCVLTEDQLRLVQLGALK